MASGLPRPPVLRGWCSSTSYPFDAIGTARVSQAIANRICRVVLGYQDAAAERQITRMATGTNGQVVDFAVTLTRAAR